MGMGVNIPNVEYIIHLGCSTSIPHYWQEVGRCARDLPHGKAIIYPVKLEKSNPLAVLIKSHMDNEAVTDELLVPMSQPYVRECKEYQLFPNVEGYWAWTHNVQNPNYVYNVQCTCTVHATNDIDLHAIDVVA